MQNPACLFTLCSIFCHPPFFISVFAHIFHVSHCFFICLQSLKSNLPERPSRWRSSKTWRSPSSSQIHQKYIYVWNNSYRTPTECWQKTSDFPKDALRRPTHRGRAKSKAEPQEMQEQRRGREISPSSLRAVD